MTTTMRTPDRAGRAGQGWKIPPPGEEYLAQNPAHGASLAVWLLTIPGAHPLWHSYVLAVVHLRDIPGTAPASKQYPEAEYEVMLMALNPDEPLPDVDAAERFRPRYLTPSNLVEQVHGITDEQAVMLCDGMARAFIDGILNPDTDFRQHTVGSLRRTVEHLALGGHPEGVV